MANEKFHFEIVTPEGIIFEEDVDEVRLPTIDGQITILPHHIPLYAQLGDGEAVVVQNGKESIIAVLSGIVEVGNNKVSIISDYAIHADSIEMAKAEEAKKRAEDAKANKTAVQDFVTEDKELRKSILQLKVGAKARKSRVN